jgi:hypothetical protein
MNHEVQDNSSHGNDDVLFDRLVDGELSADERRQLLASLDDRADGWRRCAIAFLEAQSWGGAMRGIVRGPAAATTVASVMKTPAPSGRVRWASRTGALLAMAAALLVAFGLGRQWSGRGSAPPSYLAEGPTVPIDSAPSPDKVGPERALAHDLDAVTLIVQDRTGAAQRVRVPLVDGSRLGQEFADSPQWAAPGMRQRLAEHGYDLQAKRRYAPLYFEQQDRIVPMIVPVDDAVVTPVSRPVY